MTYYIVIGEHPYTGETVWDVTDKMLVGPGEAVEYLNMEKFENLVVFPLAPGPDDEIVRHELD